MPTERSIAEVAEFKEIFADATVVISTNYTGQNVASMEALRTTLRANGAKYRVGKNTLARIAADEIGRPEIKELVNGPCGFVVSAGDPAAAAKVLVDHVKSTRMTLQILGGALQGRVISSAAVEDLASLPSREVLLARLFGQMNAPVTGLVTVLSGPARGLATVLRRRAEQLEGAPAAA